MQRLYAVMLRMSTRRLFERFNFYDIRPIVRAYFNVPTGTDVLGDLKSVLEGLVTRA